MVLPDIFFCHGQKHDYLSRVSQRARGATKNLENMDATCQTDSWK